MPNHLAQLRSQLLGASQRAIRHDHPEFDRRYREAVGEGESHEDFERAATAVLNVETPRFTRWRQLLLAMLELEFAISRVETAQALLEGLPGPDVLRQLRVTPGRWADYTYAAWLFAAQAALERAETLARRSWRYLIRPHPAPSAVDEHTLGRRLHTSLAAIKELRNAEAHGGRSAIQVLADRRRLDEWAVLGFWPPVDEILERFPSTTHPRQAQMAHEATGQYFLAINATAGDILRSVDWNAFV